MSGIKHCSIIPLIGGECIATEQAFGSRPEFLLSYTPFMKNDAHLVNYYENEVPYILLDEGGRPPKRVDVVASVCPCAGLSLLSTSSSSDNAKNNWLYDTSTFVLSEMKPEVLWGENAPQLAGKLGGPVRERLREIGLEHGYSFSIYTTKSLLHGVPQVRARSFYFFWRGDRVPLLEYFDKKLPRIEDVIANAKGNSQTDPINPKTPSVDDPLYRYVLEKLNKGISHREFVQVLEVERARNTTVSYLQNHHEGDWRPVRDWLLAQARKMKKSDERKAKYEREAERCDYRMKKLADNKGFMAWGTCWPKGYIGAFVGHLPHSLTHPVHDRYITYREAMTIMGLPRDFELLNPRSCVNHICQNVPVQTARDMASEVRAYLEGKRPTVAHRYLIQRNETQRHEVPGLKKSEESNLTEMFAA